MRLFQILFLLFLLILLFVFFFSFMEVFLRFFRPQQTIPLFLPTGDRESFAEYHPLLGWAMIPNATGAFFSREFSTTIKINSQGFRDEEFSLKKSENRTRIAVIGDSMVYGFGVENNETFSTILGKKLGEKYEVLNFGVSGYGTDQYYLLLNTTVLQYTPDVVVIEFYPNDLANAGNSEQYDYPKPLFTVANNSLILTNVPVPRKEVWDSRHFLFFQKVNFFFSYFSHTWIFFKNHVKAVISKFKNKQVGRTINEFDLYRKEYSVKYAGYQELQKEIYKKIAGITKERKISLLILYIPTKESLISNEFFIALERVKLDPVQYDIAKSQKVILEIAKENNLSVVDLSLSFQNKSYYYFKNDPHLTKQGHAATADVLYQYIKED